MQAGAGTVLNAPDSTGSVPSQLAREKGHRFLAHYLEEYVNRHVNKSRCGTLFAIVQSSFCVLHARMSVCRAALMISRQINALSQAAGLKFLALYCRHWTQRAAVSWLLNTQLCPLIWALTLGLLAVLVYKVSPALPIHTSEHMSF